MVMDLLILEAQSTKPVSPDLVKEALMFDDKLARARALI